MPLGFFPLITPEAGADAAGRMPSLSDYRGPLADQLGSYLRSTIGSGASAGEPGRWALVDDLKDDEGERARYAGAYLYLASGSLPPQQRRIRKTGYEGPGGAVALSRVLENGSHVPTNPSVGSVVEITSPLGAKRLGTVKGLDDLINEALARFTVTARLSLSGNGTYRHNLSAYPWINRPELVDGIYDWSGSAGTSDIVAPTLSGYEPTLAINGASVTLETGSLYTSAETFQLKVFVPANRLIYDGSIWGYAQTGLTNDGDQAVPAVEHVVPLAMAKGLEYLPRLIRQQRKAGELSAEDAAELLADVSERLPYWRKAANQILEYIQVRPTFRRRQQLLPQLQVVGANF